MSYSKSHVILIAFALDTPDSLENVTTKVSILTIVLFSHTHFHSGLEKCEIYAVPPFPSYLSVAKLISAQMHFILIPRTTPPLGLHESKENE
jgi:hypothetical protein